MFNPATLKLELDICSQFSHPELEQHSCFAAIVLNSALKLGQRNSVMDNVVAVAKPSYKGLRTLLYGP